MTAHMGHPELRGTQHTCRFLLATPYRRAPPTRVVCVLMQAVHKHSSCIWHLKVESAPSGGRGRAPGGPP
jgi:hypothetical protein